MRSVSVRRALRLGVCGAAVAGVAVAGLGAAPAVADEPQSDQLWIQAPYEHTVTVAPDGGAAQYRELPVGLYHDNDHFTVTDGRVTVDASGLAGVAEVAWPDNCAPSGSTAVCSVPEVPTTGPGYRPQVDLKVRAVAGAATGAQGRITYEARATGGPDGELVAPQGSFETTVRVGSGPDLRLTAPAPLTGVRPGATLTAPSAVTNTGNEPAQGFGVQMWATYGLDFATKYPQCTYTPLGDGTQNAPMTYVSCAFDTVVAPGATVELPEPLRIAVAGHALYERLDVSVEPGGGATDLTADDNHFAWRVDADNTADFAVRGTQFEGEAGETVRASFRFVNRGPAWVGHVGSGDPAVVVDFYVPEGTTVTAVPDTCQARSLDGGHVEERLGAPRYACYLPTWAEPDVRAAFSFGLRVDRVVPDATGRVVARPDFGTSFPFDPQPRNNTAEVVVNPAG
jgi:hypothetical protein